MLDTTATGYGRQQPRYIAWVIDTTQNERKKRKKRQRRKERKKKETKYPEKRYKFQAKTYKVKTNRAPSLRLDTERVGAPPVEMRQAKHENQNKQPTKHTHRTNKYKPYEVLGLTQRHCLHIFLIMIRWKIQYCRVTCYIRQPASKVITCASCVEVQAVGEGSVEVALMHHNCG